MDDVAIMTQHIFGQSGWMRVYCTVGQEACQDPVSGKARSSLHKTDSIIQHFRSAGSFVLCGSEIR